MKKDFTIVNTSSTFSEIYQALSEIAFQKTIPFCYSCYIKSPTGVCLQCHSDDLMRLTNGGNLDWWHIVETNAIDELLDEYNLEIISNDGLIDQFDDFLDECYESFKIGGCEYLPSSILRNCDPVHYDIIFDEFCTNEILSDEDPNDSDKPIIKLGNNNYKIEEIVDLIEEEQEKFDLDK